MDQFALKLEAIINAITPYVWVIAAASVLVIGIMLIIPNEQIHQKAIHALPYVLVGCAIALGAVTIGKWLCNTTIGTY